MGLQIKGSLPYSSLGHFPLNTRKGIMKQSRRAVVAGVIVAATATLGVVAAESPAMAAYASCHTSNAVITIKKRTCSTASVHANAAHDIRVVIYACKNSPWWVWDINTGRSVAHGAGSGNKVIHGLYGYYKAKLTDGCKGDLIALQDY